jgi:hypothetical protein
MMVCLSSVDNAKIIEDVLICGAEKKWADLSKN